MLEIKESEFVMVAYKIFVLIRSSCSEERIEKIQEELGSLFDEWGAERLSEFEFQIYKEEETIEEFPLWRGFRKATWDDCYWVFFNPITGKPTIGRDVEPDDTLYSGYKGSHKDTPLQYVEESLLTILQERRGVPLSY